MDYSYIKVSHVFLVVKGGVKKSELNDQKNISFWNYILRSVKRTEVQFFEKPRKDMIFPFEKVPEIQIIK